MSLILNVAVAVSIPLLIVYWVYRLVRRGYEIKALVERGVPVTARVTQRRKYNATGTKGGNKYVAYEFLGPDGATHNGRFAASDLQFDEADVGLPIEVVCLPDRPSVNATREIVELSRPSAAGKGA